MVIIVALAIFLLTFFCFRRHIGPALLATIAGLAAFQIFGSDFTHWIHDLVPSWDPDVIEKSIYFALILVFPMLLYFRSGRGGLHGLLRLAQAIIFSLILTTLIAAPLAEIFNFDDLARTITDSINSIQGYVVIAGIAGAYLDILLYRNDT